MKCALLPVSRTPAIGEINSCIHPEPGSAEMIHDKSMLCSPPHLCNRLARQTPVWTSGEVDFQSSCPTHILSALYCSNSHPRVESLHSRSGWSTVYSPCSTSTPGRRKRAPEIGQHLKQPSRCHFSPTGLSGSVVQWSIFVQGYALFGQKARFT